LGSLKGEYVMESKYTKRQGQYLAFMYYYTKIHGCPPAEADIQKYFRVSPPTVHQMVVTLEKKGLIEKMPHQARSIRLLVAREELPELE
jgi:repressor LexA